MKKKRVWTPYGDWTPFDVTPAITLKAGIKLQSKGAWGSRQWWSKRWIAVLESFEIGARLGRGRSYARRGQVISISITKGKIEASVQGSRPIPYQVTIRINPIPERQWAMIAQELSGQALFAAKLLSGIMPETIETIFHQAKCSLFPERHKDVVTECSCPDWSNPCKHIAAVYYLVGEEFDRDPFLIFRLRGMERDELVQRLGFDNKRLAPVAANPEEASLPRKELLPVDPAKYWGQGYESLRMATALSVPSFHAVIPKQLGHFPFWRGTESLLDALERVYEGASETGIDLVAGEYGDATGLGCHGWKPGQRPSRTKR